MSGKHKVTICFFLLLNDFIQLNAISVTPSQSPTTEPTLNTQIPSLQPSLLTNQPSTNTNTPTTQTKVPSLNTLVPTLISKSPTDNSKTPTKQTDAPNAEFNKENFFYYLKKGDLSAILFILIPSLMVIIFCGTICCAYIQITRNEKIYVHSKLDATSVEMEKLNDGNSTKIEENLMKLTNI